MTLEIMTARRQMGKAKDIRQPVKSGDPAKITPPELIKNVDNFFGKVIKREDTQELLRKLSDH